jgi:hypothetical protein
LLEDANPLGGESRANLVNWIMEVGYEMRIHRKTVQTAINYLDRFNAHADSHPVDLLQPLCICAIYIAAKKEELEPKPEHEFTQYLASHCHISRDQFAAMERKMLEVFIH